MLIEQLINLEKVRTDNLKFRTDLRLQVMDGWSVRQIAKKIFKSESKIKAGPVNAQAGHYMAFKHRISFAIDFAANFGCYYSNLSRRPFLGQVVGLDLLLCTGFNSEHAVLFLCHIFTQRPMTDRKIERSDGRCFGRQQLLADSIEILISYEKKKVIRCCPKFTKH